eukprot:gnl/Chilomastix_cuspidata/184.p1 GENE.gnl/Chilomastix_cuspidata/184~~gnl/Chilomastix_cuspidata/184.p1  ORF type:complete len:296 (+),score=129.06 gnl/Chilomastix_cuspidata/184:669-1556(+)
MFLETFKNPTRNKTTRVFSESYMFPISRKRCVFCFVPKINSGMSEAPETLSREDLVFLAKIQENAERFDEMAETMQKVARLGTELDVEERNLLSVAYKNIIGTRRAAWRVVNSIEAREKSKNNTHHVSFIEPLRRKVEKELIDITHDILNLLEHFLVPSATSNESKIFYFKMQGDYYRYSAEFKQGDERKDAAERALAAYSSATELSNENLSPTHPIRLGLALNFSVFYYEILGNVERACALARESFDEAVAHLDSITDDAYRDATLILQLLRDNLSLWVGDLQSPEDEDGSESK